MALTALLLGIEYLTGLYTQFPVVYVIPVGLAAWYSGRWPALTMAAVIPLAQLVFTVESGMPQANLAALLATTAFRGAVILFIALWCARLSAHERELFGDIEALKGLLPICMFCKSIRNESGEWERLERFVSSRSGAKFSHGMCPSCKRTHYPDDGHGGAG